MGQSSLFWHFAHSHLCLLFLNTADGIPLPSKMKLWVQLQRHIPQSQPQIALQFSSAPHCVCIFLCGIEYLHHSLVDSLPMDQFVRRIACTMLHTKPITHHTDSLTYTVPKSSSDPITCAVRKRQHSTHKIRKATTMMLNKDTPMCISVLLTLQKDYKHQHQGNSMLAHKKRGPISNDHLSTYITHYTS